MEEIDERLQALEAKLACLPHDDSAAAFASATAALASATEALAALRGSRAYEATCRGQESHLVFRSNVVGSAAVSTASVSRPPI
eukprot:SAG11_NODE_2347_length_3487_cov_1.303129_2_plen_84_part_00